MQRTTALCRDCESRPRRLDIGSFKIQMTNDSNTQAIERVLGPDGFSLDIESHSIDGLHPKIIAFPRNIQQLSEVMAAASDTNLAVTPWGGGTRMALGNGVSNLDMVVDLSRMSKVIAHNPADLTATVEAGVRVESLRQTLAEHGQFLALDPPLPDRATIGGTLAAGVSGPLKAQYGNPRDLVIGMKVVQADGAIVKSGGEVVKNVSGYDMARLHIGGLGTLGIIAEISFKLTPLPRKEATLLAAFDTGQQCIDAGLSIFRSYVMPLALIAFDGNTDQRAQVIDIEGNHFLAIRLGGRPRTLERQLNDCASICREYNAKAIENLDETQASAIWRKLADFGWDKATTPLMSGRASVLPSKTSSIAKSLEQSGNDSSFRTAMVIHPGYGTVFINWFAKAECELDDKAANVLEQARDAVHRAEGRMIIERCPANVKAWFDVWDDVGEPLMTMRRMKEQYDPKGILNRGRFVGGI